ncbi:MAG: rRNA maturation RNase YbeY [Eubacteriaceae bacterium]|nr:rRNA maturation RNase YbeY [Eubacteriaceae bacterium]
MIQDIDFQDRSGFSLAQEHESLLISCLKQAAAGIAPHGYELSVCIVSEDEIADLNEQYRGKAGPTDVLSFPMNEIDARGVAILGDIVINPYQAQLQAGEYGHSFERELVYLGIHSLLHLVGYDHENETDKEKMREMERHLMASLGISR